VGEHFATANSRTHSAVTRESTPGVALSRNENVMPAEHRARNCRVVAARIRLGVPRADGRRVGERDRQVHFVALPEDKPVPLVLRTLCGDPLAREVTDLLDSVAGMPCVRCLASVPQAAGAGTP
jgi:hypothetical protein